MENKKVVKLIDKLCEMTVENKLVWERLYKFVDFKSAKSENRMLSRFIEVHKFELREGIEDEKLLLEESYCSEYNDGYVYLLSFENYNGYIDTYRIAVQIDDDSKVKILEFDREIISEIRRLLNIIESKTNNVDKFLDSFF